MPVESADIQPANTAQSAPPVIAATEVHVRYDDVHAVRGVSLAVARGRTFGIVGESGSGKSSLARALLRLTPIAAGEIRLEGRPLHTLSERALRPLRPRMQMVFQDPLGSLNPRLTVETLVGEALTVHGIVRTAAERRERVVAVLERVGLGAEALRRYPHEFSGGQRQRIAIARALVLSPRVVICDEPVAALDASIQSQILNLLAALQAEQGISYVIISHDMAVMRHLCDDIAVMWRGEFVEQGPAREIFARPQHAYSRALLAAAGGTFP